MAKNYLFIAQGHIESDNACELLNSRSFEFEPIDVREGNRLCFIEKDMGISIIPALITPEKIFEGLAEIEKCFE